MGVDTFSNSKYFLVRMSCIVVRSNLPRRAIIQLTSYVRYSVNLDNILEMFARRFRTQVAQLWVSLRSSIHILVVLDFLRYNSVMMVTLACILRYNSDAIFEVTICKRKKVSN